MSEKAWPQRVVIVAALVVAVGGAGYGALHMAGASSRPVAKALVAAPTTNVSAAALRPAALTGTWVFKNATTIETLRLRVDKKGVVRGDGASTVKSTTDPRKTGAFSISVHDGRLRNDTLTLALWVQQQFGYNLTEVENLRCAPTSRVLHCRMSVQIVNKVYSNIPQDFYRR